MKDDVVQDLWSLLITHYFIDLIIEIVPIEVWFGTFTVIFAVVGLLDWSLDKASFSRVLLLGCSWDRLSLSANLGLVGIGTIRTVITPSFLFVGYI